MNDPANVVAPVVPVVAPVVVPPTPAPAPTPAPVVAPTPAPVVPEAPDTVATAEDFKTGNAALDASIGVLVSVTGATAADLQRIVGKAMEYGDPNLVDTAFVQEKFSKHATQMIALAQAAVSEQAMSETRAVEQVYSLAGGKANWDSTVSIFNQNAPEHLKEAAKMLLDAGQLEKGARLIMDMVQSGGFMPNNNGVISGGAVVPSTNGALSAAQFQQEIAALKKEAGNRSFESGPYAQKLQTLMQRRNIGRSQGL